jgi:hypothetical protein
MGARGEGPRRRPLPLEEEDVPLLLGDGGGVELGDGRVVKGVPAGVAAVLGVGDVVAPSHAPDVLHDRDEVVLGVAEGGGGDAAGLRHGVRPGERPEGGGGARVQVGAPEGQRVARTARPLKKKEGRRGKKGREEGGGEAKFHLPQSSSPRAPPTPCRRPSAYGCATLCFVDIRSSDGFTRLSRACALCWREPISPPHLSGSEDASPLRHLYSEQDLLRD